MLSNNFVIYFPFHLHSARVRGCNLHTTHVPEVGLNAVGRDGRAVEKVWLTVGPRLWNPRLSYPPTLYTRTEKSAFSRKADAELPLWVLLGVDKLGGGGFAPIRKLAEHLGSWVLDKTFSNGWITSF